MTYAIAFGILVICLATYNLYFVLRATLRDNDMVDEVEEEGQRIRDLA